MADALDAMGTSTRGMEVARAAGAGADAGAVGANVASAGAGTGAWAVTTGGGDAAAACAIDDRAAGSTSACMDATAADAAGTVSGGGAADSLAGLQPAQNSGAVVRGWSHAVRSEKEQGSYAVGDATVTPAHLRAAHRGGKAAV